MQHLALPEGGLEDPYSARDHAIGLSARHRAHHDRFQWDRRGSFEIKCG